MALFDRERTGVGRWVQTSLLRSAGVHAGFPGLALADGGRGARSRPATIIPTGIPTGVFPTSDGNINIAASSGRLWDAVLRHDRSHRLEDAREWKTQKGRSADRAAINAAIGEITRTKPADALDRAVRGERHSLRADLHDRSGVRRSAGAAPAAWRGPMHSPTLGDKRGGGIGDQHLRRSQGRCARRHPRPGAHTDEVLRSVGYSDDEISQMRSKGVI